ncbi:MAG: hypothetical protein AAB573_01095 [Patescibacteria group bacterium]
MERMQAETGAISPERLERAFRRYFETQTTEQIVNGLNERAPELLVHFNNQNSKEVDKDSR